MNFVYILPMEVKRHTLDALGKRHRNRPARMPV